MRSEIRSRAATPLPPNPNSILCCHCFDFNTRMRVMPSSRLKLQNLKTYLQKKRPQNDVVAVCLFRMFKNVC